MKKVIKISAGIIGALSLVLVTAWIAGYAGAKYGSSVGQSTLSASESTNDFYDAFQANAPVHLASFGAGQPIDLTDAADKSVHAVVHIKAVQHSKTRTMQRQPDIFDFFFGDGNRGMQREYQTRPQVGFGSGVIISSDGYIVTNNHVIEGADEISVRLNDNRDFLGRIIGTDPDTDLALVKIEAKNLPTLVVGNSDDLKIGEWVLAVGNPFNLTSTVTAGIVSAKARSLGVYNKGIESFIQTDAAINQGNSGGALVNSRGELIGINAVLSSPTGAYAGYGFAIPTSIMTKVITDLKEYGTVQRAVLGIMGSAPSDARYMGEEASKELKKKMEDLGVVDGVLIAEILDNSSASAADLRVDDVIVGIDNKRVINMASLQEELAKHKPGDKVTLKVVRKKKEQNIPVVLMNAQGTTKEVKKTGIDILGAGFVELPSSLKSQLNLRYGLQVTGVQDGKMKDAGVRKGFIILKANGQPIRTVQDLEKVFQDAQKTPEQVIFLTGIFQSGKRANYAVELASE